ncbi:MAG: winged helix-turn-helix transcriptional regulator [Methanomicrobia archaeon]|nr:winged helix-turn-helix transcriptional regulator [Methanomicrobia archaeon]
MKLPCEIIVKEVLPTIRSAVVFILYNEYKLTQTEIAEKMGITQASVNQYIQKTRGRNRKILDNIPEIKEKSKEIAKTVFNDGDYLNSLCDLCKDIRKNKEFYRIYKKVANL